MSLTMDLHAYMQEIGGNARAASKTMARANSATKNAALIAIANGIETHINTLIEANQLDMKVGLELDSALLDRLELTPARIKAMADGLREIAALNDPIGEISDLRFRPSGIQVGRMRVPLGVIGVIYESRPNVTADVAGLTLKSGNAVILRGGSEAINSNQAIAACVHQGLQEVGLPAEAVQIINTTDRQAVTELLQMPEYVDVIVPRGGKSLIERISKEARIPVIKHLDGVCHVYVDDRCDLEKAITVAYNAKCQRYGTCNTMETLLVAEFIAKPFLKRIAPLYLAQNVELRGCESTCQIIPEALPAGEEDWYAEYLAPILAIRVVSGIHQAIEHIEKYGSHHTDTIMTEDLSRAKRFLREVDSSSVMVNASTRFADGFEYGLGAEVGISTDKFHARGPVGLEGLTSQKFIVLGDGHIRQ